MAVYILRWWKRDATITIPNAGTVSSIFDARNYAMFGLIVPAAFTSTSISFQVGDSEDATFQDLYDNTGTHVTLTVAQGKSYDMPTALAPWPFFKIIAGTAEGAARTITVVSKG
jgi:hypothetical protein